MASPPATRSWSFRHPSHMALLLLAALLAAPRPTRSWSSSNGAAPPPTATFFCSVQSPAAAVTSGELANFLDAVCAGAYGAAHMFHSMSVHVSENRTVNGVAQCRPDVAVPDCRACLAAASSRLVAGAAAAACAASAAVWHDACFLRYSAEEEDGPSSRFREDEQTATVFSASRRALSPREVDGGRAVVRRLLAAVTKSTMRSHHMCRGAGAGTTSPSLRRRSAGGGGGLIYGLTRCAPGVSCDDCRRCLRGAVAVAEREYNGSAGMQVLRLSCMVRYESHPFYNDTSIRLQRFVPESLNVSTGGHRLRLGLNPAAQPTPAPPGGNTPQPPVAAQPPPQPSTSSIGGPATAGGHGVPTAAQPTPSPPGGHTEEKGATQHSQQEKTREVPIISSVPTATGIVVIAVVIALILHRRRKKTVQMGFVVDGMGRANMYDQGKEQQWDMEEEDDDGETTSCQLYSYHVLEAATCHFSSSNKLGSGGFGTVFKGTLESGKAVAVKRLRESKRKIHELEEEISIVADLRHKNLVRFLGYCFQEEGEFLVYEYVPNNSLAKFWYEASFQSQKLDWGTWFNIILGVARGLRFLHEKGIIHRDLKPHNVLLDKNFNPKIADFDLMRVYDKQKTHESTEKVAGTFGYMAPECTSGQKFLLSIKSDVYSYGVLVLEIITGHKIYTFEGQNSEGLVEYVWQHWMERRPSDVVDIDLLGVEGQEHAQRQALRCVHVALLCVQADRSRRPDMGQVISMLSTGDGAELPEPSLPGYVVRPTAASGFRLPCLGYMPCHAHQDLV